MPSYQTARLGEYDQSFFAIAAQLANHLRAGVGEQFVSFPGSYSLIALRTGETVAKIIIFQPELGTPMRGRLPLRNSGVYILLRLNGVIGDSVRHSGNRLLGRAHLDQDMGVAPRHDERFAFFPVMAGENLQALAQSLSDFPRL